MYLLWTFILDSSIYKKVICWLSTLGQRKFAHGPFVGPTCWFYSGQTCWANKGPMSKLTLAQRRKPTLAQRRKPTLTQRWPNVVMLSWKGGGLVFAHVFNAYIKCLHGKKERLHIPLPPPPSPAYSTPLEVEFALVGSAPDPLNQQVNHMMSRGNALQRHVCR